MDAEGKTVWQVQGDELPGISLKFMGGFQRLPNGNTVMCNWLGHNQFGKAPHLIEMYAKKRSFGMFADHQTMRTILMVSSPRCAGRPGRRGRSCIEAYQRIIK